MGHGFWDPVEVIAETRTWELEWGRWQWSQEVKAFKMYLYGRISGLDSDEMPVSRALSEFYLTSLAILSQFLNYLG